MENNFNVGIYLFEQFHGKKDIGSSRIRGRWLEKYWDKAEVYKIGRKYDRAMIYQKVYHIEHAKAYKGTKILDLCDPDWLDWGARVVEMIGHCDGITTSTEALAEEVRNFTSKPVRFIEDRMDLEIHKPRKVHIGKGKTVVWFGYSTNFPMLQSVLMFLDKFDLDLIVISDSPFMIPSQYVDKIKLTNYKWSMETVNADIIKGDIVVNPQSEKGRWKYKSNNKTITSYLLNMPVADNIAELQKLIEPDYRTNKAKECREWAEKNYDVNLSIQEYEEFIKELEEGKTTPQVEN